jgi:hypothetical protein
MTAVEVLDRAMRAGVTLEGREGQVLRYFGPAAVVATLLSELTAHKAELLVLLAGALPPVYDEANMETAESLLAYAAYRGLIDRVPICPNAFTEPTKV